MQSTRDWKKQVIDVMQLSKLDDLKSFILVSMVNLLHS